MRLLQAFVLVSFFFQGFLAWGQEVPLTPGEPLIGQVAAVTQPGGSVLSSTQYTFSVPPDASEATFNLIAIPASLDLDLEVRLGQPVGVGQGAFVSDYFSETVGSGSETVVVDSSSAPPLTAGTYYVGIVNYEMTPVSFFLTASHNAEGATSTETPTATPLSQPSPTVTPIPEPSLDPTQEFLQRADLDQSGRIDEGDLLMLQALWKSLAPLP